MPAPNFKNITPKDRRDLVSFFGGDIELAEAFWEEIQLFVNSAERYQLPLCSRPVKRPGARYGKELDDHMEAVKKASKNLRKLLDKNTLSNLMHPPSREHIARDRSDESLERWRTLHRLLGELENEVSAGDWARVVRHGPYRTDFMLANAIPNLLKIRAPELLPKSLRLIQLVFSALSFIGMTTDAKEAMRGAKNVK